ncbi:hypothetical protein QJS10_CPA07g01242 [Acorus calamus]|uniref:Uncharacterized protein n=1 Tax=Acorus calamus TaxID=4465 RepID=A0AAV9EHK3_ACOCL|nr:hypothetical protein QJS10_CPA07g01242 [Acorus calamus]
MPTQPSRPLQQYHSFGSRGNSGVTASAVGDAQRNASPRLFEDLVDLKNKDGGFKGSGSSTSLSGASTNPAHSNFGQQQPDYLESGQLSQLVSSKPRPLHQGFSSEDSNVGAEFLLHYQLSMRRWFSGFVD